MKTHMNYCFRYVVFSCCIFTECVVAAPKVDGAVLINQASAMAGGITPGDAPGFPVTISRSGNYRLSGDISVAGTDNAFEITSPYVAIDLNRFKIQGPVTCSTPVITMSCVGGIPSQTGVDSQFGNISIFNGSIRGFGNGVQLGRSSRVYELSLAHMHSNGIVAREGTMVRDNIVDMIGGAGINAWIGRSDVRNNLVTRIKLNGIEAGGDHSVIFGNLISEVGGYAIFGTNLSIGQNTMSAYTKGGHSGQNFLLAPNSCSGLSC